MPNFDADCRSISGGGDKGFLSCASNFFFNPPVSNNNDEAFDNLGRCVANFGDKRRCLLIGHGNVGFIATGGGNCWGMSGQRISNVNKQSWIYQLRGTIFTHASLIILCSCDTGAGEAGADLLYQLSEAADCFVWASTGLVWCNGGGGPVYLDRDARWQVGIPGIRPEPIPGHSMSILDEVSFVRLYDGDRTFDVPIDDIQEISIINGCALQRSKPIILKGGDLRNAVNTIEFRRPKIQYAQPAAMVTGEVAIKFAYDGHEQERTFTVYNEYLFQDQSHEHIYYLASHAFSQFSASIFR